MLAPNGAKLEVTILIDQDKWNELKAFGWSDKQLEKAIEKSITISRNINYTPASSPVFDIESATLLKYY